MQHIITDSKQCSGCTACMSICPNSAIFMEQDEEGFLVPTVNESNCINCSKCMAVCPEIEKFKIENNASLAFAFQNQDYFTLKKSSSGSFFPAIAKFIIKNNGFICGCILDDNLIPIHIVTNELEKICLMQDSKYVQSDMGDCFSQIYKLLQKGISVLFVGTSCQVAGLKKGIVQKGIDDSKLITVDFFCHGVPSPLIWNEYLNFYRREKKAEILTFRFRNKKYGWGKKSRGTYHLNTVVRKNKIIKNDDISLIARMWYSIFFSNYCLRGYCYNCPYSSLKKPADFTMADFWGVEELMSEFTDGRGCSLVIPWNEKSMNILQMLQNVKIKEISIEKAIRRQANAFSPSPSPESRDEFWQDFNKSGFGYIAKKYFRYDNLHKAKDLIHRIMFELHLVDLYK